MPRRKMRRSLPQLLLLLPLLLPFLPVGAELASEFRTDFDEQVIIDGLTNPTDLEFAPDGSLLLITEQGGRIYAVDNFAEQDDVDETVEKWEVLNLDDKMCHNGSRGLWSVTFHPSYPASDGMWAYVFYTPVEGGSGDCFTGKWDLDNIMGTINRLSRYPIIMEDGRITLDDRAEDVLLETPVQMSHVHNGGDIAFGTDGLLYLTIGNGLTNKFLNDDGIHFEQALDVLFGKIVRLTPEGDIPEDNPYTPANGYDDAVFCGKRDGYSGSSKEPCAEIFAVGLRNPFRFAFDPNSKDSVRFWINDVGGSTFERILEGRKGANYGYPEVKGPCPAEFKKGGECEYPEQFDPSVHWQKHDEEMGGCITGGAFVPSDIGWPADFEGSYLYGEYKLSGIYRISPGGKGCPYPECEIPTSDYEPTKALISDATAVVSMQFGPYLGGTPQALYYMTRGSGRGNSEKGRPEGLVRIAYLGTHHTNENPLALMDADVVIGFNPLTVRFDGTRSSDPDGDDKQLSFIWDFDGDGKTDSTLPADTFVYDTPGLFEASLTVTDSEGATDKISVDITVDNAPPVPVIENPSKDIQFAVGDSIRLVGSATDSEDDSLPPSSLIWEIREVHGNHYHTIMGPMAGNEVRFVMPGPLDFDLIKSSYLQAVLKATDSRGLSSTAVRTLRPKIVSVNFDSSPSGLDMMVFGQVVETPTTVVAWENQEFEIEALGDETGSYEFIAWSDGGEQAHSFTADPSGSFDVVAFFEPVEGVPKEPVKEGAQGEEQDTTELEVPGTEQDASVVDDAESDIGMFELLKFSIIVDLTGSASRRLDDIEMPPVVSYLHDHLGDIASESLQKQLKTLVKASDVPLAKPTKVSLTRKRKKILHGGERYKAVFVGIVAFERKRDKQQFPTTLDIQSMQVQALSSMGNDLVDDINESVPGARVSSVVAEVIDNQAAQEDATNAEGTGIEDTPEVPIEEDESTSSGPEASNNSKSMGPGVALFLSLLLLLLGTGVIVAAIILCRPGLLRQSKRQRASCDVDAAVVEKGIEEKFSYDTDASEESPVTLDHSMDEIPTNELKCDAKLDPVKAGTLC